MMRDSHAATDQEQRFSTCADPQDRFLAAVRESLDVARAAVAARVTRKDVDRWTRDEEFAAEVEWAQQYFIAEVEAKLIKVGVGDLKGNAIALLGVLNAHHYAYGRVRVELLRRILDPLVQEFVDLAQKEFGPQHEDTIKRICEKFSRTVEVRFAAFSKE